MKVLITGGTGFVGLALAEALLARGEEVVLFDLGEPPAEFVCTMQRAGAGARLHALLGDVREAQDVGRACVGVTHVFHGAAITAAAGREQAAPREIFDVNLGGTVAVLQCARDAGVRRFVFPSSVSVYGESLFDRTLVNEADTPPVPEGLYGVSKYAAERAALRLGALWGVEVVAGRIGNVFGPWERDSGLRDLVTPLAQIAAAAVQGREAVLPDASLRRDLVYSRDLARALLRLLDAPRPAFPVYNLSVAADWSDFYRRWCRVLASRVPGFRWRVAEAGENANIEYHDRRDRARLDTTRATQDLGFLPAYAPEEALADYARWVQEHPRFFGAGAHA